MTAYLEHRDQFSATYAEKQRKQRTLWDAYIAQNGWGTEMVKSGDLTALVQGGIPDELRGSLSAV